MTREQPPREVTLYYLIRERSTAVNILDGYRGLYDHLSRSQTPDTRVVERIDVNGHASGVCRQFLAATHGTVAKTARIVGAHRLLVVSPEIIYQTNAGNWITTLVEFLENLNHIIGYRLVANHLAMPDMAIPVDMQQPQVAQVLPTHRA